MAHEALAIAPRDEHNLALAARVHPPDWRNPEPDGRYNLVVVGAGTAGLVCAVGAASLGAKVAIIERDLMGGDCLNFGCVPSKAMIRSGRAVAAVKAAGDFGVDVAPIVETDFAAVMERMRRLRAELSRNDSAERLRSLGADVFFSDARFTGRDEVEVGGTRLRFRRAAIATGARAATPSISGLAEAGFLTNETVFSLTNMPRRIAVIGAGPIGCELSQTFRRLGAEVSLLEAGPQVLPREDRDAAERIERVLRREGVAIATGCAILRVDRSGGDKVVRIEAGGAQSELAVDEILVAVGRKPAVEGLGLDNAGVEYDAAMGIKVDDFLRTTNPRIYAAGDCASALKFTHLSEAHARILLRNTLFMGRQRVSGLAIPWCTYTDPEIAHVGLSEAEALRRGVKITTLVQEMAEIDRAVLDGDSEGFVKVHLAAGSDRIVGATIVASHAGEMLGMLTSAIANGIGLARLADVIQPYPTQADAIRRLGNQYNRARLTPLVAGLMRRWFRLMR
jgi:pyruvate/2-oxoglutarate dehydrogenase complex dihydrolipoamide dehydrogenase (E3) component